MTAVATRRRRKTSGSEKPQASRARAGEAVCGEFLRAAVLDGIRWEQRCDARLHGSDERHHPSRWAEVGPVEEVF